MATVELCPTINDRLMLAAGSGREELLPDEAFVASQVEQADVTPKLLTEWIMFSVELCRVVIQLKGKEAALHELDEDE